MLFMIEQTISWWYKKQEEKKSEEIRNIIGARDSKKGV